MSAIVLVPCYQRAEFLEVCLEQIRLADQRPQRIVGVVDDHAGIQPHKDVLAVLEKSGCDYWRMVPHRYQKNSFAVLTALQWAYDQGADWIYYVEEDVLVTRDFFRWSQAVHADGDYFATVACQNNCHTVKIPAVDDPEAYYTSTIDYSALGVCLPRRSIPAIVEHARPEYFSQMSQYVKTVFPQSSLNPNFSEQDGLIRRIIERDKLQVAWPYQPRGFHIGWYGSNRTGRYITGGLDEQIRQVRANLNNKRMLNAWSHSHKDIEPVDLNGHEWNTVNKMGEY